MPETTITEQNVSSFRDKLDQWSGSLDDGERAILQMVMVRAFPESDGSEAADVEGFRHAGSGRASGKPSLTPFVFTKTYDKASPILAHGTVESFVGTPFAVLGPNELR